jgi:SAM-dependent methyltransferase
MSGEPSTRPAEQSSEIASSKWFTEIIKSVTKPINFQVLVALIALVALINPYSDDPVRLASVGLLIMLCIMVFYHALKNADDVEKNREAPASKESSPAEARTARSEVPAAPSSTPEGVRQLVDRLNEDIYGARAKPPNLDSWYKDLLPTLHQAPFYSVPTYFLDRDLYILDYNPAFELIFHQAAGYLRGRHVNWFIAQLQNHQQVHEHGRAFTERVTQDNIFPLIDLEPLVYDSLHFGQVEFLKIASQLNDHNGDLQGWAVALAIKKIKWQEFEEALAEKLRQEKLWSVYAPSYDRILLQFPPYQQLVNDVIDVLTGQNLLVADLGAGTGNVSIALLKRNHRVVAVENSIGMLDQFLAKELPSGSITVIKDSIGDCERLKAGIFDGVVMVNVLYAMDDPVDCLKQVHRLLKSGGVIGLSTTHRETRLDELLIAIKAHLVTTGKYEALAKDYLDLRKVNRDIERTIARRWTREEYQEFLRVAGFEITRVVPSTYHNAVMVLHARKP